MALPTVGICRSQEEVGRWQCHLVIRWVPGTDIFRPIPNSFRGVEICPYPSLNV